MKALPQDQVDFITGRHGLVKGLGPSQTHRPFESRTGFGPVVRDMDGDPLLVRTAVNYDGPSVGFNSYQFFELQNRYNAAVRLNGPNSSVAVQLKYHLDHFNDRVK